MSVYFFKIQYLVYINVELMKRTADANRVKTDINLKKHLVPSLTYFLSMEGVLSTDFVTTVIRITLMLKCTVKVRASTHV